MTRTKGANARAEDQGEQLAAAVNKLADEVGVLRQALDEFREIFRWAVHNGKLCNAEPPQDFTRPQEISVTPQLELDQAQFEAIAETVQQSLSDAGEDLEEAVRDQLKHELSEFRESLMGRPPFRTELFGNCSRAILRGDGQNRRSGEMAERIGYDQRLERKVG